MEVEQPSKELTYIQVLVLALFTLGGDERPVDTEVIAVKANELAPGRFSWRLYPDQISLESVRRNLAHAKRAENGSPVAGSATRGWYLTPAGVEWAAGHLHALEGAAAERVPHDREAARRRRLSGTRIYELDAWRKYVNAEDVSIREAEAVFRLSEYLTVQRRQMLIDRAVSLFSGDDEIGPFVMAMAEIVNGEDGAKQDG